MKLHRTSVALALALAVAGCGSDGGDGMASEASVPVATTAASVVSTVPAEAVEATPAVIDDESQADSVTTTAPSTTTAEADTTVTTDDSAVIFGVDDVIRFDAGATSTVITNAVVRAERNRHALAASAGQTLNVAVTSLEDNAVFDVLDPYGATLIREATTASIVLSADGVYSLILSGTRGNATYDLAVEIPAG